MKKLALTVILLLSQPAFSTENAPPQPDTSGSHAFLSVAAAANPVVLTADQPVDLDFVYDLSSIGVQDESEPSYLYDLKPASGSN